MAFTAMPAQYSNGADHHFSILPEADIEQSILSYFADCEDRIRLLAVTVFGAEYTADDLAQLQSWTVSITRFIYEGFVMIEQPMSVEGFALSMQLAVRELLYNPISWASVKPVKDFVQLAVPDLVSIFTGDEFITSLAMSHECLARYQHPET